MDSGSGSIENITTPSLQEVSNEDETSKKCQEQPAKNRKTSTVTFKELDETQRPQSNSDENNPERITDDKSKFCEVDLGEVNLCYLYQ